VLQDLQDREVVGKLFETIAPRFQSRAGGYTRLLRLGFRKGDAAEIAQVELVGSEFNPRAKAEKAAKEAEGTPRQKGVGGRLRAAAERLRGRKPAAEETGEEQGGSRRARKGKDSAKSSKPDDDES